MTLQKHHQCSLNLWPYKTRSKPLPKHGPKSCSLEVMPFMSVVSSKQVVNVEITNLHLVMSNGMFIHQAGKPTLSSLPGYLVEIHATSILVARMPCTPKSAQNMILYILSLVYNNKYTYNNLHILWRPNKKFYSNNFRHQLFLYISPVHPLDPPLCMPVLRPLQWHGPGIPPSKSTG